MTASERSDRSGLMWLITATSWLVLAFMCFLALGSLATKVDPWLTPVRRQVGTLLIAIAVAGFVVLQQRILRRRTTDRTMLVVGLIVIVAALTNAVASDTWALDCVAVAAAALCVPRSWALAGGLAVWLLAVGGSIIRDAGGYVLVAVSLTTLLAAAVLYSLTRLAHGLSDAYQSRETHALTSVDLERRRISRGLHDIIGRVLVAASLRNEAALALLDRDPERTREQLMQLQTTLQQGQRELRRLVAGDVITDLSGELDAGSTICSRLGITWVLDADELPDGPTSVLAAVVVREGITNMLKHSSPRQCEITIRNAGPSVDVAVVNDGNIRAVPSGVTGSTHGTGLDDLRARVEKVRGRLEAGGTTDERFRLFARLPVVGT